MLHTWSMADFEAIFEPNFPVCTNKTFKPKKNYGLHPFLNVKHKHSYQPYISSQNTRTVLRTKYVMGHNMVHHSNQAPFYYKHFCTNILGPKPKKNRHQKKGDKKERTGTKNMPSSKTWRRRERVRKTEQTNPLQQMSITKQKQNPKAEASQLLCV